ncbi:MAG: undecaprenyl-phosphate galactose phosphotransferase WbaP [bacterium]
MKKFKPFVEVSIFLIFDILSLFIIFKASIFLRKKLFPLIYSGFKPEVLFGLSDILWIFPLFIFFLFYEGLYNKKFFFWGEIKALWKAIFLFMIVVFSLVFISKMGEKVSRTAMVIMESLLFFIIPPARISIKRALMKFGLFKRKAFILGGGETGKKILEGLKKEPLFGYEVVGFFDDDPSKEGKEIKGVKIYYGIDNIKERINKDYDVIIAIPSLKRERLVEIINMLQDKTKKIIFVPDLLGIAMLSIDTIHFFQEQTLALEIKNNILNPGNTFIKRIFDILIGSLLFIILSPFLLFISLALKVTSEGPVIYSQKRIGKGGRPFMCLKFRTMSKDAEERLKELLKDENIKKEYERYWKIKDDPRVTKIGRFLRRFSLDELPQIINVLKGEMSLVGPRPAFPEEIEAFYKDKAGIYFLAPPGITGLWQISGRSEATFEKRIFFDVWYVKNWSLWLDIVILFKTIKVVLKKEGAY